MSDQNSLVSICIPTYNGERYLEETLASALNQTYQNIEIIISDDNSTDYTLDIVNKFQRQSHIPFYIYKHKPTSIGANWNNCVKNAHGNFVKFLFQDDILYNTCVEVMVKLALKDENIGLVFSKREIIWDEEMLNVAQWRAKFENLHIYWNNLQDINYGSKLLKNCKSLLHTPMNKVGEPTAILLRKKVFEKVGYFNENLTQVLDFEFWYRVFKYFKIGFIDTNLVKFRLHSEQATNKNLDLKKLDYELYNKLIFKNLFFQLHFKIQLKLLLKKIVFQ